MVFVLDKHKQPLMPCSEKRARLLLQRKRAVVHRLMPFTIRLRDRSLEESALQPIALKLDPGSKTTGMALSREEQTSGGAVHHALSLAHLEHRGEAIHQAMLQRAGYRRRRRSANLRYRAPRFLNRRRVPGWLAPSLRSRVRHVVQWSNRYVRLAPIRRIEVEWIKFDTQLLQRPELSGIDYQRGELLGWEIRAYRATRKSLMLSEEPKNSSRLVSKPVSNPCVRSWQREGTKPGVMSKGKLNHPAEPG